MSVAVPCTCPTEELLVLRASCSRRRGSLTAVDTRRCRAVIATPCTNCPEICRCNAVSASYVLGFVVSDVCDAFRGAEACRCVGCVTENLPSHLIGPLKATTSLAAFSCLSTGYPRGRDFRSERGACRGASGITRWAAGAIRGAATKISARLPAIATVEKRRVLSRVRRGALYLSHRRYEQSPSEQPCRKPSSLPASPVRSGHRYR